MKTLLYMRQKERLEYLVISILVFFCLFLMVYLIWSVIYLPFQNPEESSGPLTKISFNPSINFIRYLLVVVFLPSIFIFFQNIFKRFGHIVVRILLVIVLSSSLFFSYSTDYLRHYASIDMFHVGERVSPGSAGYYFNKKPFTDIFFLHGAFTDYYSGLISFKLFQPTIGSFLFFNYCFNYIVFILFNYFLHFSIKNNYLFYLSAVVFFGSLSLLDLYRDIFIYIYLIVILLLQNRKISLNKSLVLLGSTAYFSLFHSIDRGLYLMALNFLVVGLAYFMIHAKQRSKRILTYFKQAIIPFIISLITLVLITVSIYGYKDFCNFVETSIIDIPRMSSLMFDYEYPSLTVENFGIYWFPLLLLVINGIYILKIKKLKSNIHNKNFLLMVVSYLLSILFYRSALGRSDYGHVRYAYPFILLTSFLIIDHQLMLIKKIMIKCTLIVFSGLLIISPFFLYSQMLPWRPYSWHDIKIFFSLPTIDDNYWLTEETKGVIDRIQSNTSRNDYIFVFSNEVLYYHLLERMSPTKYYIAWFAEPKSFQAEVIQDLTENKPRYIIYKSALWTNEIDGIQNSKRLAKIDLWLKENYTKTENIGNTILLTY